MGVNAQDLALEYIDRNWSPIPIPYRSKAPAINGWQTLSINADNVGQYFNGAPQNIGIHLGAKSKGLTDVDLDCPEAITLARHFLPTTESVFGRASKPRSHYLFYIADAPDKAAIKLIGADRNCIIELRMGGGSKGAQTVFPGSVHEAGETISWAQNEDPTKSTFAELNLAISKIALAVILIRAFPPVGCRHDAMLALGGFLARAGWDDGDIGTFAEVVARESGSSDPRSRAKAAIDAAQAHSRGEKVFGFPALAKFFGDAPAKAVAKIADFGISEDGCPEIHIIGGKLAELATAGEDLLIANDVPLYQRGGSLVRPIIEIVDASHGRKTKVAQLKNVDAIYLRDLLCRYGKWMRYDARSRDFLQVNPPLEIGATILGRVGEWKSPALAGVISAPTLRLDGSLLIEPGYDEQTRLLLIEPPAMPRMPEFPTRHEALKALALIEDLLTEFPFIDDIAKTVALAAIITPIVRGAFTVSPMFLSNAPTAGTGKSFLWDIVATISIGQLMPVMAAGRTEEETEKRLGSALIAGQPLINIDNISGELSGDALCQIIERPIVDVRILGKSENKRIEARTTLFGSGNNVVVRGDLTRRVLTTTLDSRLERPELREFKSDPIAKILDDRGAYIAACLIICRAYIAANRPDLAPRLASFGDWSDVVRSPLIWLGKSDCILSMELARQDDPERTELSNMLSAWTGAVGVGTRTTLATIVVMAGEKAGFADTEPKYPELSVALHAAAFAVTGKRGQLADPTILGLWLRRRKGRVVDGLRFVTESNPKGGSKWWIEQIK